MKITLMKPDFNLWKLLVRLYLENPLSHVYLLHTLIYEIDKAKLLVKIDNNTITGYTLIRKTPRHPTLHCWGDCNCISILASLKKGTFRIRIPEDVANEVFEKLTMIGKLAEKRRYFCMATDGENFKPFKTGYAVKLDNKHAYHLIELEESRGRRVSLKKAEALLSRWRCYGVFDKGKLVSIACVVIRLPEVWVIGNVYTHPLFRGKGYAKVVTSAATRDAINSGARAMLHVREDNIPAISVYKNLGYMVFDKEYWVTFIR
ncbi:MAG: hypothetical protein DRJ47_07610 [Thermoprotei archaeon]|nr:MAG: hypothetical protein DRJ47_07610 [Thermoprotei archaeon]